VGQKSNKRMERNMEITQQLVKELFEYRDGVLYWKIRPANRVQIGDKVGSINSAGYLITRINNKHYQNHRIIFLYHHGYLPQFIDHKDCNPLNNRLENLREATYLQNNCNASARADNTSGVKGVCWDKCRRKWQVRVSVNGKEKHFGRYHDIKVAKFIAETMRYKYHKDFARHA